ncbi:MAG: hypothetical protein IT210_09420 [Armatimonadetes bacterium]|nr:hypothetical protein [Armatimonadota bacterium]
MVTIQQTLRPQAPALTVPQVRSLWQVVLPQPVFDVAAALRVLQQIQRASYAAYRSHRQRTLWKSGET